MSRPRFAIVNTGDNPYERLVAELKPGFGYCYMQRDADKHLRRFDGMQPVSPTSMEEFGFRVVVADGHAMFERVGESKATYSDGKARRWQGTTQIGESFLLPLIGEVRRKGEFVRNRERYD